jgi:hypothetical protein
MKIYIWNKIFNYGRKPSNKIKSIISNMVKCFYNILVKLKIIYYNLQLRVRKSIKSDKKKIIIHLYTICWNEEKMLPFFLDYYSDYVDKITVFDNYSTDNSEQILKRYKNVKVLKYNSDNKINEILYLKIKNNSWKKSSGKADFVIVCDIDEFLYSEDLAQIIKYIKENKYTIVKPFGYQMVSEFYPDYRKEKKITDIVKTGYSDNKWLSKSILFDPNKIIEINYSPGCHECSPTGKINFYKSINLKFLHYKDLSIDHLVQRKKELGMRLSQINIENGWATYYLEEEAKTIEEFESRVKKSVKII